MLASKSDLIMWADSATLIASSVNDNKEYCEIHTILCIGFSECSLHKYLYILMFLDLQQPPHNSCQNDRHLENNAKYVQVFFQKNNKWNSK